MALEKRNPLDGKLTVGDVPARNDGPMARSRQRRCLHRYPSAVAIDVDDVFHCEMGDLATEYRTNPGVQLDDGFAVHKFFQAHAGIDESEGRSACGHTRRTVLLDMPSPAVVVGDDPAVKIEDDDLLVEGVDEGSGEGFADAQGLFRIR